MSIQGPLGRMSTGAAAGRMIIGVRADRMSVGRIKSYVS